MAYMIDYFVKNEVTSLLEARWMSLHTLYDSCPGHAARCFDSWEPTRMDKINQMLEGKTTTDEMIADAYNKILAEEIESYIQTETKDFEMSRADLELEISKTMLQLYDVFGTDSKQK